MSGGGGSGDSKTEIRYAAYVEAKHSSFLSALQARRIDISPFSESPYSSYKDIEVEDAFFGAGFTISSFPALYDMYGKFMAGLDIEVLYGQIFEDTVNSSQVTNLIAAESALLDDEIEINSLPRLQTGMRDINSVISSSFVIAKSLIEDAKTKSISKFSAELKYRLIPVVSERWGKHLAWNQNIIQTYIEIMRLYYTGKIDVDEANLGYAAKHKLWPFTVMEFERAGLGALQGATNTTMTPPRASGLARAVSGAASGAALGSTFLPGWGTAIGAIFGGLGGIMG